jgi:fatty-acyl-CoA synthase
MPNHPESHRSYVMEVLDTLEAVGDAVVIDHGGRRLTGRDLLGMVHRMAAGLRARGLESQRMVTILSVNTPEALAARYAAHFVGCRVSSLYPGLSAGVQASIVRDVEADALLVDPRLAERARLVSKEAPVPAMLSLGPADVGENLLEAAGVPQSPMAPTPVGGDDLCVIRHTGGTTGHPKGIAVTFGQMALAQRDDLPLRTRTDQPRLLVCTPLAHLAGRMTDLTLRAGGKVVLLDAFDATEALETIARERITHMFLLPPLLYALTDRAQHAATDVSSLVAIMYGGTRVSPDALAAAVRRFGQVLIQIYGQNEVGAISVLPPEDHDSARPEVLRSAGRPLSAVEVSIRDPEDASPLPVGTAGEICVRSPTVMSGYWKQPELTDRVLRDGWVHTGDIGRLDSSGRLTVIDRLGDKVIVVGGHVYPAELEDALNVHPAVEQSAAFGVSDARDAEEVVAVVIPAAGRTVTPQELRDTVRDSLGPMYVPARILIRDRMPLTDAGKADKAFLRRLVAEESRGEGLAVG